MGSSAVGLFRLALRKDCLRKDMNVFMVSEQRSFILTAQGVLEKS